MTDTDPLTPIRFVTIPLALSVCASLSLFHIRDLPIYASIPGTRKFTLAPVVHHLPRSPFHQRPIPGTGIPFGPIATDTFACNHFMILSNPTANPADNHA